MSKIGLKFYKSQHLTKTQTNLGAPINLRMTWHLCSAPIFIALIHIISIVAEIGSSDD